DRAGGERPRSAVRYRLSGSPRFPAESTSTWSGTARRRQARYPATGRKTRARRSIEYSFRCSCSRPGMIAHHSDVQIGDAGGTHVAKRDQLLAIGMIGLHIEQQDVAAENLALVNRLERPCCSDLLGPHHDFRIARLEFLHAATEHD